MISILVPRFVRTPQPPEAEREDILRKDLIQGLLHAFRLILLISHQSRHFFSLKIWLKQSFDCYCFWVDYFVQTIVHTILGTWKNPRTVRKEFPVLLSGLLCGRIPSIGITSDILPFHLSSVETNKVDMTKIKLRKTYGSVMLQTLSCSMLKLATLFRVMRAIDLSTKSRITTGACVARMSKTNKERMNLVAVPRRELYFHKTHKHRYERNDKLTESAWHVVRVSFT